MSQQYFGAGTLLKYGGLASPPAYNTVGGIKGVIKGTKSAAVKDITTHDVAASDKTMRKAGGLIDPGKYTFTLFTDPNDTQYKALRDNLGSTAYFQLVPAAVSPSVTISFQAVISDVSDSYPLDDFEVSDVTLDVTGPKTIA